MVRENVSAFTAVRLAGGLPWPLSHIVPLRTRLAYWWQHRDLARRTVDNVSAAMWCSHPRTVPVDETGQVFGALMFMHRSPSLVLQVVNQLDETCKALKTLLGEREQFFSRCNSLFPTGWFLTTVLVYQSTPLFLPC